MRGATAAGSEFTERCRRAREGDPSLRDALAARAKTIKRDQEQSKRAERRHTHARRWKRLPRRPQERAAPYIQQEGDFAPVEPEITDELQARAEAALGAAPPGHVLREHRGAELRGAGGRLPGLPRVPRPRRSRQPRRRRGAAAVTRGDQLDRARFAAPPRAPVAPPATTGDDRSGGGVAAAPRPKPKRKEEDSR